MTSNPAIFRLWRLLDRPNVFIKVPATVEGLPAIRELISEGIDVNVTPRLEVEAIAKFNGPSDALVASVAAKRVGVSVA
jgi:hypothetical protein